jgi:hypothetical protein
LVFEKNANQFFRRKLAKIAEYCDHNIDPSMIRSLFPEIFDNFLRQKLMALAWVKVAIFSSDIFGENVFKITLLVHIRQLNIGIKYQ